MAGTTCKRAEARHFIGKNILERPSRMRILPCWFGFYGMVLIEYPIPFWMRQFVILLFEGILVWACVRWFYVKYKKGPSQRAKSAKPTEYLSASLAYCPDIEKAKPYLGAALEEDGPDSLKIRMLERFLPYLTQEDYRALSFKQRAIFCKYVLNFKAFGSVQFQIDLLRFMRFQIELLRFIGKVG